MRAEIKRIVASGALAALACSANFPRPASALEVVLNDVAPDRIERQRRFNRSELSLPGTPDLSRLDERLKARDLAEGRPIYIRVFKAESELELWMQNSKGTFSRLATYPICHWYGSLGPKLQEGDKQSPEGFYRVGVPQTRLVGRWRKAFNLGFPNVFDQRHNRTGSYILIHGGCSSVGCFAMTDPVQDEIYGLATAALAKGQARFSVHVFPFRMTEENMKRYGGQAGSETWQDLKPAYDSFERTHVPPRVAVCATRYKIADGLPSETGGTERRLPVLRQVSSDGAISTENAANEWSAPSCQFEDEAERIAYYSSSPITTSATTTASADTVQTDEVVAPKAVEPPKKVIAAAPKPERIARGSEATRAVPAASAVRVAAPPPARRQASRPLRRGTTVQRRPGGITAADGFGSSGLRATQGISTHGG